MRALCARSSDSPYQHRHSLPALSSPPLHPPANSIEAICERYGLDADATLDNIIVARAYASDQQVDP